MSFVYVASSWKNPYYDMVVDYLKNSHYSLYDFKHPASGENGFHWNEIDPEWESWDFKAYRKALEHPLAVKGFGHDMSALCLCDRLVCVLPCGRSAHLELGYAIGAGKKTFLLFPEEKQDADLMYKAVTWMGDSLLSLREALMMER